MSILKPLTKQPSHLKMGILGFAGGGKTMTAVLAAIMVRKHFGLEGPIAGFDTEPGFHYVNHIVKEATGQPILAVQSRTFDDLKMATDDALEMGASVFLADSVTHPWRELMDSYLARLNAIRERNRQLPMPELQFQHQQAIKKMWNEWVDVWVGCPMHVITAGRAGFEWTWEAEEEGGRKKLTKAGIKMKVESEYAFEPSLLIELVRKQHMAQESRMSEGIYRRAICLKDRFDVMDGAQADFETCDRWQDAADVVWEFIAPHVTRLKAEGFEEVDLTKATDVAINRDRSKEWATEKRLREEYCEEIKHELLLAWPSSSNADKLDKAKALQTAFNTGSWKRVEGMRSDELNARLSALRTYINETKQEAL